MSSQPSAKDTQTRASWTNEAPSGDPFEQGSRAAGELIPADANPYSPGSAQAAQWSAGHAQIASAQEAGESEDT